MKNLQVLEFVATAATLVFLYGCNGQDTGVKVDTAEQPGVLNIAPAPAPSVSPSPSPSPSPSASPSPSPSPTPYTFQAGAGTLASPYHLESALDVDHIRDYPAAYFTVTQDINLGTLANWTPIPNFSGTLYGNNFYFQNLKMVGATATKAAFAEVMSGTIVSLKLQNVDLSGVSYVAGFAGHLTGLLSNCSITGDITSPSGGNGLNTGVGLPIYVTKSSSGSTTGINQFVTFNGNVVHNSF